MTRPSMMDPAEIVTDPGDIGFATVADLEESYRLPPVDFPQLERVLQDFKTRFTGAVEDHQRAEQALEQTRHAQATAQTEILGAAHESRQNTIERMDRANLKARRLGEVKEQLEPLGRTVRSLQADYSTNAGTVGLSVPLKLPVDDRRLAAVMRGLRQIGIRGPGATSPRWWEQLWHLLYRFAMFVSLVVASVTGGLILGLTFMLANEFIEPVDLLDGGFSLNDTIVQAAAMGTVFVLGLGWVLGATTKYNVRANLKRSDGDRGKVGGMWLILSLLCYGIWLAEIAVEAYGLKTLYDYRVQAAADFDTPIVTSPWLWLVFGLIGLIGGSTFFAVKMRLGFDEAVKEHEAERNLNQFMRRSETCTLVTIVQELHRHSPKLVKLEAEEQALIKEIDELRQSQPVSKERITRIEKSVAAVKAALSDFHSIVNRYLTTARES